METIDLGVAVSSILVASVLGYIASNLYFVIHWKFCFHKCSKLDYRKIATLYITPINGDEINTSLRQREAWAKMNIYWNFKTNGEFSNMLHSTDKISNVLHSIGTTIIILIIGVILGVFTLRLQWEKSVFFALINLIIIAILCINYRLAAGMLQNLYEDSYRRLFWAGNPKNSKIHV